MMAVEQLPGAKCSSGLPGSSGLLGSGLVPSSGKLGQQTFTPRLHGRKVLSRFSAQFVHILHIDFTLTSLLLHFGSIYSEPILAQCFNRTQTAFT